MGTQFAPPAAAPAGGDFSQFVPPPIAPQAEGQAPTETQEAPQ